MKKKGSVENNNSSYQLRALCFQDISQAIKLSNAEKWNQTEKDWALLIQDPQNICMAALNGDRIIGTSTAIIYANDLAWIGMVLVEKSHRGKGVSKLLLSNLFEQLKLCRSIKLDATPAGQPVYQQFGFKDEYLVNRMTAVSVTEGSLPDVEFSINPVQFQDIPELVEYDKITFGANRKQLIEYLIKNYPAKGWTLRRNGRIAGFVLGRDGSRFCHIGPVMTSSTEDAKQLLARSFRELKNQPVVIDILDDKKELVTWLNALGFTKQRHFIRMYQNENPYQGTPENQYLICGPEFG